MNAMTQHAVNAYSQVGVESNVADASPHRLVLMLFEGAIKAVAKARLAMTKGEIAPKCEAISKAIAIVQEGLQLSLDVKAGGELAENLNGLYEYMIHRLVFANLKNQVEPLDEVGKLLVDLKNAWAAIVPKQAQPKMAGVVTDNTPPQRNTAVSYGKA
ncbi:flagellar export chaperone FliS [Sulfuricella sp.]|uniref:flagellar export chaperone FliS n=1 Tax=Sulfuricella sp. TaxID=2099377 RepID=UPI002CEF3A15|nr:flagellar export chaperone FliS [Sulfuricella sp.]HUX63630.1 flagellar export chaperone FliS [Sulfuricella sp.]